MELRSANQRFSGSDISASMRVKSTYALWNRLQCYRRLTILNVWSRRYNFNGYNFVYLAFYTRFEVVDSNVPSPGCLEDWGSPCFSLFPIDGPLNKCFNGRFISGAFCGPEFTSWKCRWVLWTFIVRSLLFRHGNKPTSSKPKVLVSSGKEKETAANWLHELHSWIPF